MFNLKLVFGIYCFFFDSQGMIEKNCWQGLEEFFIALNKALCLEAEEAVDPTIKRKSRRKRRQQSIVRTSAIEDIRPNRGKHFFL